MITIGIRARPNNLIFAIFNSDQKNIVNVEEIKIPAAFTLPEGLKYIRNNLLDVLREFGVEKAGIRITESNSQKLSIERIQIEGVVQEAFASSTVQSCYVGRISTMAANLGIRREEFKPLISGEKDPGVENWSAQSDIQREAILCAMGAVNV